jgi:CRISPR-associated endonuclease/helicase Cas3
MYLKMLEKTGTTDGLFLLNTFLAKKHQEKILEEIRLRLKTNQRCLVFSTSLVEAGVDLDFPVVFRFFGSLRSLIQALGRANRHGFLAFGKMFVVIPDDGIKIFSGTLLLELNATLTLLNSYNWNIDVYDPVFLEKFFSMFLTQVDLCQDKSPEISKFIETYDYEKVGDLYRVVDEESSQVLVPYGAGKKYIGQLQGGIKPDRKFMKKIEMYQVGVNISNSNEKIKHIKSVSDVLYWDGPYNNELGINDIVFPRS